MAEGNGLKGDEFLRGIVDTEMLLLILDEEGRIVSASKGLRELLGLGGSDTSGLNWFETFIPKERYREAKEIFRDLLAGEGPGRYETPLTLRDGRERIISWGSTVLRDETGRPVYVLSFGYDVTEWKSARERLKLVDGLLDNISEWIVISDKDYRIRYMNMAAKEVYGDGVGEKCYKVYQGYDKPCYLKGWPCSHLEVLKRGSGEYAYTAKDPEGRWLEVHAFPMRMDKGSPLLIEIVRDVTRRVEAEEALRVSRRHYQAVYEAAPLAFVVWDPSGRVIDWNREAERVFGWSRREVLGRNFLDFLIPEGSRSHVKAVVEELFREKRPNSSINENLRKDGKVITCEWSNAVILDDEGNVQNVISLASDITKRIEAEKEAKRHSVLLRKTLESVPDAVFILNAESPPAIVDCNNAASEIFGYKRGEMIGNTTALLHVNEESLRKFQFLLYHEIEKGVRVFHLEFRMRRKDGSTFPSEHWVTPLIGDKGGRIGWVSVVRDITERKIAEEKLKEYSKNLERIVEKRTRELKEFEAKFKGLYDSIRDGILANDLSGRILECNKAFEEMVGYTLDELRRMRWQDITPKHYLELEEGIIREEMLRKGRSGYVEKEYIRKDGSRIPVEVTASVVKGGDGKPDIIWCIVRDISERKRLEKALLESERLAAVGSLAAQVSHDLRNPLTSISNAAYYLKMKLKDRDEKVKRMIDIILREVDYADKVLRDLLDFSKPLKPKLSPTSIVDVLEETLASVKKPKKVKVEKYYKPVPKLVLDPDMIKRAFSNIIQNAYEAMPKGGKLTVRVEAIKDILYVSFQDTGHGIPEENFKKIFQPLFTTKAKGIGLGLSTAKRIVEAHRGEIEVESEPDKGSKFTVKMPIKSSS